MWGSKYVPFGLYMLDTLFSLYCDMYSCTLKFFFEFLYFEFGMVCIAISLHMYINV